MRNSNMTAGQNAYIKPRNGKLTNMECYDRLPKALRQALASADHNWSAGQLKRKLGKHPQVKTTALAIAFIRQSDVTTHRKDADAGLVCPGQC